MSVLPKEPPPTHADIIHRQDMAALVMQRIETKLDALATTVGFTGHDEHGKLIGAGVAGDLARLKARVDFYDRWRDRLAAFGSAIVVTGAVIWWLISDKVSGVLR